jgi:HEAT repeat protein
VDGLAKLADQEAVPELERVFREARYSYLRRRAARALAITSDRFTESYAVECLWDCEVDTRALGCVVASWASATVRKRIAEMAGDRFEDRKVRVLAACRQRPLRA